MGLRLAEGIDPKRYAALSGRALDPRRIAMLREEGAIEVDESGRLRVTQAGFPVLDAVVADLAAYPTPPCFPPPACGGGAGAPPRVRVCRERPSSQPSKSELRSSRPRKSGARGRSAGATKNYAPK